MSLTVKDKFFNKIVTHYDNNPSGFTALDCAEFMPTNRSVISHYLNRLCDDGLLSKENTRPVRFYVKCRTKENGARLSVTKNENDAFGSHLIGAEGSLRNAVGLCRSAVNYPSDGLPVLISGESGVGKSYLASLIWQYAMEKGVISDTSPFIELNCADYANNPELLSATLFGYVKGAFTGAEKEKQGAFDEADGGYLLLDEVHRLSSENQEKLFLFMDKGYFYRLGDNKTRHHVKIRFVFATTEDIDTVLLTTFQRRIPVRVFIPNFISRPLVERVAQVQKFIAIEASKLGCDIHLDSALMHKLVMTPVRGNIGELRSQVKVMCATAWSDSPGLSFITLHTERADGRTLVISRKSENTAAVLPSLIPKAMHDDIIFQEFCHSGNILLLNRKLEQILITVCGMGDLEQLYSGYLWQNVMQAITELEYQTGVECNPELRKTIWLCFIYTMNVHFDDAKTEELEDITDYVSCKARLLSNEIMRILISMVSNELPSIFRPLISCAMNKIAGEDDLVQGIIVSHGRSTASSIAAVANQLTGGFCFKAFDMPHATSTREIIDLLIAHLTTIRQDAGLIILVDMGSLKEIYEEIKLHLHGELLVINNVSTAMAIDIASKIQHQLPMNEIIESVKGAYEVEARYYAGVLTGNKIIISCISGAGISYKLKDIVQRYLFSDSIEIVTMEYDDLKWKLSHGDPSLNGTRLIITTTDLDAGYIPMLSVEQLMKEKTKILCRDYFPDLLTENGTEPMVEEIIKLFTVEGIASRLKFLNPVIIIDEVELVIKQYESFFKLHFESYLRINLFMHIALMIERVMVNAAMHNRDDVLLSPAQKNFIDIHDTFFNALIRKYNIILPVTEVLMIYEILEPWIPTECHE